MLFIIQQIIVLLKLLHSEGSDRKIALAIVLGFFISASPLLSLQGLLCSFLAIFFRIQFGAFLFSWLMFSILFIPLAPVFDGLGFALLSQESLHSIYTIAQKNTLFASTRFYNTIVLGGLVFTSVFAVPLYFCTRLVLRLYRDTIVTKLKETKLYHILKATVFFKVVGFYEKYKGL